TLPRGGRGREAEHRGVVAFAQTVPSRRLLVADAAWQLRSAGDRFVRDGPFAHRRRDDRVTPLTDGGDDGFETIGVERKGCAGGPSHRGYSDVSASEARVILQIHRSSRGQY